MPAPIIPVDLDKATRARPDAGDAPLTVTLPVCVSRIDLRASKGSIAWLTT